MHGYTLLTRCHRHSWLQVALTPTNTLVIVDDPSRVFALETDEMDSRVYTTRSSAPHRQVVYIDGEQRLPAANRPVLNLIKGQLGCHQQRLSKLSLGKVIRGE